MKSLFRNCCSGPWSKTLKEQQTILKFKKGQTIFMIGDEVEGLYEVRKGKVKVVARNSKGEERLVRLAGDKDVLGHRGIGRNWIYPVSAIALEDSSIAFISKELFELVSQTDPTFSYNLMLFMSEELRSTEENGFEQPVLNRVAKAIWLNHRAFGMDNSGKLNLTIRRQEIAELARTTYETVIRSIAQLKKSMIIDTENKEIIIKDFDQLSNLAFSHK